MKNYISDKFTIEVGSVLNSSLNEYLTKTYKDSKIVLIVDENTHDNCLEYLLTSFDSLHESEVMLLPAGEENKVMEVCVQVWDALSEYRIGRNDLIVNLGGGVVTDMGGFIASVYKRGVDFINIPTTLVGMIDASIGGKTGIDFGYYKNQLGVFSHPKIVYVDPTFLMTLPEEELLNGYAEMLKHALISDRKQFDLLKQIDSYDDLKDVNKLINSIEVKFKIVEADPLEENRRKILNFGHTVGHAIEGHFFRIKPISHGHAVAIGMVAESYISMIKGKLSKKDYFDIELNLTEKFPMIFLDDLSIREIVEITKNDKKNKNRVINCSLLNEIGDCDINCAVTENEITEALVYLNRFSSSLN